MSIRHLNWAFEQSGLTSTEKLVLICLADHCNAKTLRCDPGTARLARFTGLARESVSRNLKKLAEKGLIQITPRHEDGVGQISNSYILKCQGHVTEDHGGGVTESQAPVTQDHTNQNLEPEIEPIEGTQACLPTKRTASNGRGTRLPADWEPSPEDRAFAEQHGIDPNSTAETFRDYWHGCAGQKGVKLDWPATWRNWCRRQNGWSNRGNRPQSGGVAGAVSELLSELGDAGRDRT